MTKYCIVFKLLPNYNQLRLSKNYAKHITNRAVNNESANVILKETIWNDAHFLKKQR
jgi:hypothetical protein